MKQPLIYFGSWLFLIMFFLTSCAKDDPTPSPTDPRANFIGSWNVNENWTKLTFEVTITADANSSNGVVLDDFAGSGTGIKTHAIVSGNGIVISPLPQALSNGWVIQSGSGALQGTSTINWGYVFSDQANQYTAVAVFTKN